MKRWFMTAFVLGLAATAAAQTPVTRVPAPPAPSTAPKSVGVVPPGRPEPEVKPAVTEKKPATVADPTTSPGEAYPSVDRYSSPSAYRDMEKTAAVRRAAEARAEQRTRRLESRRWFGLSNLRPLVGADPVDGDQGARWTSNYPWYPERWVGVAP